MPKSLKLLPSLRLLCIVPIIGAGGLIAVGPAAADAQELKVIEHNTTRIITDVGAAGDILTFANEVFDADDKNMIGIDNGVCFRTSVPDVGTAWECFWTLALEQGQLTVQGPFYGAGNALLAITGGTGEYAGAGGEMLLNDVSGGEGKAYSFTYRIK